jgi:type II secretory pathway component PulF
MAHLRKYDFKVIQYNGKELVDVIEAKDMQAAQFQLSKKHRRIIYVAPKKDTSVPSLQK